MTPKIGVTSWFLPVRGGEAVEWAADAGFDSIQIDMTDVTIAGVVELQACCSRTGVELHGLSVSTLETYGVHGAKAQRTIDHALDAAIRLGIKYMYLPSFNAAEIRSRGDLRATARLLRELADRAGASGIVAATENALAEPELSQLLALTDRDDVDLLFDTQNLAIRGISATDVLKTHWPRVRHCVHVKDGVNKLGDARLGSGSAGVADSLRMLRSNGFHGAVVIESDYRVADSPQVESDRSWLMHQMAGITRKQHSA